ncbi:MAG: CRTAC1 family protein [Euryarchaeota archaeon]|nr:CRTAC1 family protein [Euryarchaeota archaeon]
MWRAGWAITIVLGIAVPVAGATDAPTPLAVDVTEDVGIGFVHAPSRSDLPRFPDYMGGGACWGDYDGDGRMDLYLPDMLGPSGTERSTLYRNAGPDDEGTWRFEDVTETQAVDLQGMGLGCVWGDYDNDGWPDLFVTFATMADSARGHTLLRNLGDGRGFEDVTRAVGMDLQAADEDPPCLAMHRTADGEVRTLCFGVSAAWLDFDLDGDLDLYVGNYVEIPHGACRFTSFPNPLSCQGQPNHLWQNDGDGTFTEIGREAGVAFNSDRSGGRTLGVVATDVDGDTWPDIYVANDFDANALFLNQRDGTFREVARDRGVAATGHTFKEENGHRAGMGVDAQDLDGDGLVDLLSTHLRDQYDSVYLGGRDGRKAVWSEVADESAALGTIARSISRWGGGFVDLDLDGHKDYLVVAGNQYNQDPGPVHLARQVDGELVLEEAPRWPFGEDSPDSWRNHRGAAFADYDDDGDMDVLVGVLPTKGEDTPEPRPRLLRFDIVDHATSVAQNSGPHFLRIVLIGTDSTRDGFGTHVRVETADGHVQHLWKTSGASYGSGHDSRLLFGLGDETRGTVTVTWPGGKVQGLLGFDLGEATGNTLRTVEKNTDPPAAPTWTEHGDDGILRWGRSMAADFSAYRVYDGADLLAEVDDRAATSLAVEGTGPFRVTVVDTAGHESGDEEGPFAALPMTGLPHVVLAMCALVIAARRSRR